ncbi:hypothetical protein [Streptomyces sp. NPDC014995]|uniref:hypothetical protein n=1 Tax=Streptomyces sp. NPDC014995 TaxID=3364936 RepID=UPI0036FC5ABE
MAQGWAVRGEPEPRPPSPPVRVSPVEARVLAPPAGGATTARATRATPAAVRGEVTLARKPVSGGLAR